MLTQVAERIYWFSRYLERAENTARLILVQHQLTLDLPTNIQPTWQLTIDMLGANEAFAETKKSAAEKNVVPYVFSAASNPGSIVNSIINARENMRTTREVLPSETWERLNSLYLSVVRKTGKSLTRESRHKVLNSVIQACQQINGMLQGTMNHDSAYQFILLGRSLERADMGTRLIDVGSASLEGEKEEIQPFKNVLWISILRSLSAYQMYRQQMRSSVKRELVLKFLLQSEFFPRSTGYQIVQMTKCAESLPNGAPTTRAIEKLADTINGAELEKMKGLSLHTFIDDLQAGLGDIHTQIQKNWFY